MNIFTKIRLYIFTAILFYIGILFTIIYFSIEYQNQTIINNQYINYMSNITNYNITFNHDGNNYNGYIQFSYSDHQCWMYNITLNSYNQVYYYLNLYYPLYTLMNIYYNGQICSLYLPYETWRDLGMSVGFSIIFIFFTIINFIFCIGYKDDLKKMNK